MSKFKNKYSSGYDGISMNLVKTLMSNSNIVGPLSYICNLSFQSGVFPDEMKIAKIVPLFKSGNRQEFSNYRPVSILPQFSKMLEKLFCNRLVSFIQKNNIMP